MKLVKKYILVFIASSVLFACSSGEQNEESTEIKEKVGGINWAGAKVKDGVMRIIDKHYVDNTLRQSRLTYEFRDNVAGSLLFVSLVGIRQDSIYPMSDTRAFMRVDTRTEKGDSLIFDYEVSAKPAVVNNDSLVYEVESLNLRKVNQEQRYSLRKEGNFWVKEILSVAE